MYHIAHVNIARALAPLQDARLADFAAQLDQIYALAENSPGFIWRLRAEDISSTSPPLPVDERLFATISVWESIEALMLRSCVIATSGLCHLKAHTSLCGGSLLTTNLIWLK